MNRLRKEAAMAAPVVLFATALAVMQWVSGARTWLPVQTIAVYAGFRIVLLTLPHTSFAGLPERRSRLWTPALFLFFVRHFVLILGEEARRAFIARSLAVRRRYGPAGFTSLVWSMVSVFRRSLARAERFYAAQWLRGLSV